MALSGIGNAYNPSTINTWLKGHNGFASGDLFVWGSVNPLGLSYSGLISNSNIYSNLASNNIVIINVLNGGHWVLATSMNGNTIYVNDPGKSTASYTLSSIVPNNSRVYRVIGRNLGVMIDELEIVLNVNGRKDKMMEANEGKI